MTPKQYILQEDIFTIKKLADRIDWAESSFSRWLSGHRPIPKEKEQLLIGVLKRYGFTPTDSDQETSCPNP